MRPDTLQAGASPEDLAEALVRHFDQAPFEDVHVKQPDGTVQVERLASNPPMPSDFAAVHGFTTNDLHTWATATLPDGQLAYPRLAKAYIEAQRVQARRIRQGLAGGWYVQACVGMFLAACGWRQQPARHAKRGG